MSLQSLLEELILFYREAMTIYKGETTNNNISNENQTVFMHFTWLLFMEPVATTRHYAEYLTNFQNPHLNLSSRKRPLDLTKGIIARD